MPDVPIPSDKLVDVLSPDCAAWIVEHCPGAVQGYTDGVGSYAIHFERPEDAEAFRARWLA